MLSTEPHINFKDAAISHLLIFKQKVLNISLQIRSFGLKFEVIRTLSSLTSYYWIKISVQNVNSYQEQNLNFNPLLTAVRLRRS